MARGRKQDPLQQERTRTALLDAACHLLETKSYQTISIREIASEAGTQSRMISYYFKNKQGLFEAVIQRTAKKRHEHIAKIGIEIMQNPNNTFDILTDRLITLLLSEPWLLKLFHDEVTNENSTIRNIIIREFSTLSSVGLVNLFTKLQDEGLIRKDMNITFFVVSFMSLIGFPIMSQPLFKNSLGVDLDIVATAEWKQHISELLRRCVA